MATPGGDGLAGALTAIDADVQSFLADVDRDVQPGLQQSIARVPELHPLKPAISYQVQTGGKRIRAALCVGSCELVGGEYPRALNFAVAIEHLQNFTLIHDDIADGDTQRRAQEAIWKRFGLPHAINIGDLFVPLAALTIMESPYSESVKLRLLRAVSIYGIEMAEGQALDINMRRRDAVTIDEYLECTRKKTGAFLAMATVGGAIIGGGSQAQIQALVDFSMLAGPAFQIKDDILDVTGNKGRDRGSDVLEGKRTLLALYASERAPEPDRKRLWRILNTDRSANTREEVAWVCDLYQETGAVDRAEATALGLVEQASRFLVVFPETEAKYRFLRMSKYLSRRMH
jgi:geranylgeranyl diphosphate synthase type I